MSGLSTRWPLRAAASAVWGRTDGRGALGVIALLIMVAVSADFIASDRPIVARIEGQTHWLANVREPPELAGYDLRSLAARMGPEDWMIPPPIPWGPNQQDTNDAPLAPPDRKHWLGTDTARRDVAARLVHGSRVSIVVGLVAVGIYITIGTLLGLLAAWYGGWVDVLISRVTEAVITIPVFFLILAVMGVVESAGVGTLVTVIGLTYWTRISRLVRAEALRIRQQPYIEAATVLGYSSFRIMLRHILPNAAGSILVAATFGVASAILIEAALSFLGFGAPDSVASWGAVLRGAMGNFHAWWLVLFPGLTIFATVTAYNVAGDALRDAMDPRLGS